jgi:tRNA U34 5-methylaminomethyl-2-thiouridine-forming methyltransferase MnmC
MKTLTASIALLGLITIAGVNVAAAGPKQQAATSCYTDDGYGRKRPCSAGGVGFKRLQKASSTECFTDDGYGRKRSCSQGFKR